MQGQGSGVDTFSEIADVSNSAAGEPSSTLSLQNTVNDGGTRTEHGWLAPHSASPVISQRPEDRPIGSNILFPGGSRMSRGGPSFAEGSSSSYIPQRVNLNVGYLENSGYYGHGCEAETDPKFNKSSGLECEHAFHASASHDIFGTSSGSSDYMVGEEDANPDSSFGNWGLSCKRKTLEGTSGQSYSGNAESSLRQYVRSFNSPGTQQESASSNLSSTGRSTAVAAANSGTPQRDPPAMHTSGSSGNLFPFPWHGASSSRVGSLSGPLISRYGGAELREEASSHRIPRNDLEHPMFTAFTDMRDSTHDPTGWSLAPADLSTSISGPSSVRIGSSSSIHSFPNPSWIPPPTENQRISEHAPWSLFPSVDSQPGGQNHLNLIPPGPSASTLDSRGTSGPSNQGRQQPNYRSAFLLDRQGDDVLNMSHSLRALAADIDGRRRLVSEIRQVLNAMRRNENVRVEDYMLVDPYIYHGMAEMHDRHRDMRLDVDNMSYEELLALGERIGDVSSGLSEETILKLMKQRICLSVMMEFPADMEPCCICQEQYVNGDDIGRLDCGHDFHTNCIKQWLMQKNLCPICKTAALVT